VHHDDLPFEVNIMTTTIQLPQTTGVLLQQQPLTAELQKKRPLLNPGAKVSRK